MRPSRVAERTIAASLISLGMGIAFVPTAFADEDDAAAPGPAVQVDAVPMADNA
ncbi:MAG: hypothetical protein QOJ95_2623, partial [Mycobacterium sp.]|nr:hypothetical protein [Mycobacterium sp.]